MRNFKINIPFFLWFDLYCQKIDIINPFSYSIHPPPKPFKFSQGETEVEAHPYKVGRAHQTSDPVVVNDIIKIYQQNNYSNQILQTIASQVDHVSTKLDATKTKIGEPSKTIIQSPFNTKSQPHFKPQNLPYSITSKLAKEAGGSSSSSSSTDLLQKISSNDEISQIKAQFDDDQEVNRIKNRRSWQNVSTRNYYPRPSPPDMQYEERSKFTAHTFSPNVIHEWNIDGKSEYEIMNTLQEMGMARAAYKLRENNEQVVFSVLIAGFTGQLKNWWDNSLTLDSRLEIYNHTSTQINEDNMEVEVNDCCDYLIVVIAMYFVGNPMEELSSQKIILTNLRCPTLGNYRWYNDIFLTYVLRRPDCNEGFWMEKFVSGHLKHFSQRIFRKLKESFANEVIAWQTITYGQLFAFVKQQGLALCEELKLQSKYNSEKRQSRRELEIICFKCGKPGHKADKCFTKKKINELFQDNPEMCQKLSKLFLKSSSSEAESNDEIKIIQESSDDESYDSASSSPILMNTPFQKQFRQLNLLAFQNCLINILQTQLKEKSLDLNSSPLKKLQQELNSLKAQVNDLRNQLQNIHVNESELDLRLSALEHKNTTCSTSNESSKNKNVIEDIIAENIVIEEQFVQTIQKINFQKWYAIVTFKVQDFQKNLLALIDSGADQNCIRYGLVPHKYYETTKTQLYSANNQPLNVKFKLSKAAIVNDGYCFHNTFIVTKVETDASDIGYGGILKQKLYNKEQLVRFHSGIWLGPQKNYSTIKKEILSISSDDYEMDIQVTQPSCSNPRIDIQIPKAPTTPIKTSTTFNPLLTQLNSPALPYSQALQNLPKTQKEKEALIQNTSPFPGYFVKSTFEPLNLTKYRTTPSVHEFRVNNSKIFAQGIHWFSDNISKNQRFYEFILVDSGSADIKHERDSTGKISYSKIIINKVNSSDDWIEPFAEKDFSMRFIPQTYSYNDYKNAWSRALLLEDFDHSWFITFNKLCPQRFPIWFYQW
ncbi:hypothetical protein RND81_03G001700 [Saponaria officinalis]|uniref:CCHC-type domain-containing protein n=1 Tax=Saponaria officinalis TaxID=3572 RepID=A0AAW1M370_SAPOF